MATLRLFGGVRLEGLAGPLTGRAVQRRRLAILVLLAAAPGRSVSRDKLVSFLWPESDAEAGRHLLSGALYELRKALGEAAILSSGDDLRLNSASLHTDVAEFEAALAVDDLEGAVAAYAGPFADGFYVSGAPAFERWLEHTRERYRQSYLTAVESLAEARSAERNNLGAVEMWRRLVSADPYNPHFVRGLMHALVAAGNRAGALQQARTYGTLLRDELGTEPDSGVLELAEQLRNDTSAAAGTAKAVAGQDERSEETMRPADARGASPVHVLPRLRRGAGVLALLALLALGIHWLLAQYSAARPSISEDRVAVLPFSVRTAPEFEYLGEGMTDLLSTSLDGAGEIRTVKPEALLGLIQRERSILDPEGGLAVAERLAAGACVLGSVVEIERRLYLRAALYRRSHGLEPVAEAAVEGDAAQLFELVDALAGELAAASRVGAGERIARVGARTTHSLAALKEYLAGEHEFRAGRFAPAADAFARAVAQDSTFALAHYRLSLASLWADRIETFPGETDHRAWRHSDRLSERDRRLLEAYLAWRRGSAEAAERLYHDLATAYPDDVEAWHQFGETLFHYNPLRGRPLAEARTPFEQVLSLDPSHRGATWHLAQLAAKQGRTREFHRLLERLRRLEQAEDEALELRTLTALARRDSRAEARLAPELASADANTLSRLLWRTAVYLADLEGARRLGGFLTHPQRPAYPRLVGHASLAYLELARGRRAAAEAEIAALTSLDSDRWLAYKSRVLSSVALFGPARPAALTALRDTVAAWINAGEDHRPLQLYYLGLLSDALGDTAAVLLHATELERLLEALQPLDEVFDPLARRPDADSRGYAGTLRALAAWREGRAEEALQILDRSRVQRWYGLAISSPVHAQGFERYLRAELLHELGRYEEALGWYASFGEHALHDLIYLAPAHLRQAEIQERLGNRRQARADYAAALELWREADPELRPLIEQARQRFGALSGAGGASRRR